MTKIIIGICTFFLIAGFCGAFVKFNDDKNSTSKVASQKVKPKGLTPIVYTSRSIEKGEILKKSDLHVRKIWAMGSPLTDKTFASIDEIVGKKTTCHIYQDNFVLVSEIEEASQN